MGINIKFLFSSFITSFSYILNSFILLTDSKDKISKKMNKIGLSNLLNLKFLNLFVTTFFNLKLKS